MWSVDRDYLADKLDELGLIKDSNGDYTGEYE